MNRTELIEKIIEKWNLRGFLGSRDGAPSKDLKQILEEELPDFQRIDEERFKKICIDDIKGSVEDAVKEYNSTLPPALQPLPKEMPKGLWQSFFDDNMKTFWTALQSHYGTPEPKQPLPSVEELAKEIKNMTVLSDKRSEEIAKHIHDKYSLKQSEWWQDLKEGDKLIYNGKIEKFHSLSKPKILFENGGNMYAEDCTPYTITADEIIKKHNLSEEEVRLIREGKG